jgi:hypothetical protein
MDLGNQNRTYVCYKNKVNYISYIMFKLVQGVGINYNEDSTIVQLGAILTTTQ